MQATSVTSFLKNPLVIIVTVALLMRLVLMPLLTYDFDIYHWALIISNIDGGNNLYNLDGYYYTPVWGYLLGFISEIEQFLVNIGPMGIRFTDMLPIEDLMYPYHIATVTSIGFNIGMKIPLILCDLAVGYLVYWLVKDRTGDKKKATYGLALWLFCPIVIYMSAVQSMFDTFSALLLLLAVIMFYKDKCFIGGMLFSTAVLLKFFPAFCIVVLIAYIVVKHRDDGLLKKKMLEALSGMAIMAVVLLLPLILNGQLGDSFGFVFGRTSGASLFSTIYLMVEASAAIIFMFYFGYKMYRTSAEKADKMLFAYILFTVAGAVLISITPQYVIILIPFLILHILANDITYLKLWIIIGTAAFFGALLINNYSLLSALASYTDLSDAGWLIAEMRFLETTVFGYTVMSIATSIANLVQYIGTLLVIVFGLSGEIAKRFPKLGAVLMRIKGGGADSET